MTKRVRTFLVWVVALATMGLANCGKYNCATDDGAKLWCGELLIRFAIGRLIHRHRHFWSGSGVLCVRRVLRPLVLSIATP